MHRELKPSPVLRRHRFQFIPQGADKGIDCELFEFQLRWFREKHQVGDHLVGAKSLLVDRHQFTPPVRVLFVAEQGLGTR